MRAEEIAGFDVPVDLGTGRGVFVTEWIDWLF